MKDFPLLHKEKVKQESKEEKKGDKKIAANNNIDEEPLVVNMKFPALSRSLKRAKSSLPKDRAQKRAVVKALFEDTIPVTPRKSKLLSAWSNIYLPKPKVKGRKAFLSDETKEKLDLFLSRNGASFTLSWWKSSSLCWEGCQWRSPVLNHEIFTVDIPTTCWFSTNRRWWGAIIHYIFNTVPICEPKKRICW